MKIFLTVLFCFPLFAFGQKDLELQVLVTKYDSISSIPDMRLVDDIDQFLAVRDNLEKSILSKTNKSNLITFYKKEIPLTFRKLIVRKLLAEKDTTTVVQLFKETISRKDTLANNHVVRNFNPEIGQIIYNGELFEYLTMDPKTYSTRESVLKDELLDCVFKSRPLNENLISNIQFALPLKEEYYNAVKQIIIEKNFPYLLTYIAKFQKQEDIEFIKSFGKYSFLAIQEFPDEKFVPFLEQFSEMNIDNGYYTMEYYKAIAKYCSPEGKILVEKIFKSQNKDRNDLLSFLERSTFNHKTEKSTYHYCALYYSLIKDLWIKDETLDLYVFENYTEKTLNKKEFTDYLYQGFIQHKISDHIYLNEENPEPSYKLSLIKKMKDLSTAKYYEIVEKYISEMYFLEDLDFIIKYLNDDKAIFKAEKTIRNRLDTEENPYYLIQSLRALVKLKNKNLFNYGVQIIKKRKTEILKTDNDIWIKNLIDFEKKFKLSL